MSPDTINLIIALARVDALEIRYAAARSDISAEMADMQMIESMAAFEHRLHTAKAALGDIC